MRSHLHELPLSSTAHDSVTLIEFYRRTLSASSLQGKRTKSESDEVSEAMKILEIESDERIRTRKFENRSEGVSYSALELSTADIIY